MMEGDYYLSGIDRMHERPIKDLVDSLEQMGAVNLIDPLTCDEAFKIFSFIASSF